MQYRYAGDVGDFGKFGLLRHLCRETAQDKLKPGVIWYKTTPGKKEEESPHGKFTNYLQTAIKKPDSIWNVMSRSLRRSPVS